MSKDYISRQAAIDYLMTNMAWYNEDGYEEDDTEKLAAITDLINGVPSAESERKTGTWIYDREAYPLGNPYGHYVCDQCGESVPHKTNYCQNCGCRMDGDADV